jgi:iron complex transport system substrate-binding protein
VLLVWVLLLLSLRDTPGEEGRSSPASRIVSLAPSLTELVCALGLESLLVARSSACDYPERVTRLPVAGDFGRPNIELLHRVRPDLVLITDLEKPALLDQLKRAGMNCLVLQCEGWDDMMSAALTISERVGMGESGADWVSGLNSRRDALSERVDKHYRDQPRPKVYIEVWGDPVTTAGGGTFLNDLVEMAGGRNIAAGLGEAYPHISAEWVIKENPDVILLAYMLPAVAVRDSLLSRPGWDSIAAVRSGRICCDIEPDLLLRPGPRMIDGAEQFADWLMANGQAK